MRVLITGATGMLGRTLARRWAARHEVQPLGRAQLDVTDAGACDRVVAALRPQVVVHCAAHTAVDRCESEVEAAYRLNAVGSLNVAMACHRHGSRMVALSTDYVFAGDADRPYHEWDVPAPRTVYGASKLAGEQAVRNHCPDHVIARVAWLYGAGGPSFVHTMLKLGAQDGPPMRVVADQFGNPTSTDAVADALDAVLECGVAGTVHLTCEGEATWCDLAAEIFRRCGYSRGIIPCTTAEYPRPAPRPANSRLDKLALRAQGLSPMPDWREALQHFLTEHPHG